MNKYVVWKLKGIDGPNTGPVKVVGVATGDEIETGVVVEGEQATTGAEVVTGVEDDVITGAVIGAGRVFTTAQCPRCQLGCSCSKKIHGQIILL